MVIVLIFAVFPLYWGSLWKTPVAQVDGWVVVSLVVYLLRATPIYELGL
jgi:hypothetical protein